MGVVDEPIQDGVGVGRIADDFMPALDRELRGHHRGSAPITFLEDFEEVMPGGGVEGLQSPIVEDQKVSAAEVAEKAGMASIAARQREILEQPRHALVEDRPVVATRLVAERRGKPALAHAGRANDILPKNSSLRLSSSILITHLPGSGSWPFDALRTVGWIILW